MFKIKLKIFDQLLLSENIKNKNFIPLANYHSHTYRCKHANGEVVEFVKAASQSGLKIFGVSDHTPFPDNRWSEIRMPYEELDNYVEAVLAAKKSIPQVRVLLGMECEYIQEFKNYFEDELLGKRNFEYLIGAAHYTPYKGEWLNSFSDLDSVSHLRAYSEYICKMIESKLFTFIAHPDIFGTNFLDWNEDLSLCSRDILKTAEENKIPLEMNGNGLRKKFVNSSSGPRPPYPWRPFWELAAEFKVKVVCNSDCHNPNEVIAGISENLILADKLGLELADLSYLLVK